MPKSKTKSKSNSKKKLKLSNKAKLKISLSKLNLRSLRKSNKVTVKKTNEGPRKRKKPQYKSFRLHKKIKTTAPKLPSAFKLFKSSLGVIRRNKRAFLFLTLIYALLSLVLVRGFDGSLDVTELKDTLKEFIDGNYASLAITATLFGALVTSTGKTITATGSVYQSVLLLVICLATIWMLRKILINEKVRVKDAFYKGMGPLVPFLLVLMAIGFQLIPLAVGSWIYNIVSANGIAITVIEKVIWFIIFMLLVVLSLYMISSSIFALFIVTLPNMTPMKALRSARQLVLHRRWQVIRKLIFLPFGLVVTAAIIMLPILLFLTDIADMFFFVLTMLGTIFTLTYVYLLYRELLNE